MNYMKKILNKIRSYFNDKLYSFRKEQHRKKIWKYVFALVKEKEFRYKQYKLESELYPSIQLTDFKITSVEHYEIFDIVEKYYSYHDVKKFPHYGKIFTSYDLNRYKLNYEILPKNILFTDTVKNLMNKLNLEKEEKIKREENILKDFKFKIILDLDNLIESYLQKEKKNNEYV